MARFAPKKKKKKIMVPLFYNVQFFLLVLVNVHINVNKTVHKHATNSVQSLYHGTVKMLLLLSNVLEKLESVNNNRFHYLSSKHLCTLYC